MTLEFASICETGTLRAFTYLQELVIRLSFNMPIYSTLTGLLSNVAFDFSYLYVFKWEHNTRDLNICVAALRHVNANTKYLQDNARALSRKGRCHTYCSNLG